MGSRSVLVHGNLLLSGLRARKAGRCRFSLHVQTLGSAGTGHRVLSQQSVNIAFHNLRDRRGMSGASNFQCLSKGPPNIFGSLEGKSAMKFALLPSRVVDRLMTKELFALAALVATVLLTAQLARSSDAPRPTQMPLHGTSKVAHAPTYEKAISLLCTGRHAEAYGRLTTLADDSDARAGRTAPVLHQLRPTTFQSNWDASTEQLKTWTRWSLDQGGGHVDRLAGALVAKAIPPKLCEGAVEVLAASDRD